MSWTINLTYTNASDGSPVPGITITKAATGFPVLATTDQNGTATFTLDVDTSTPQALYIAGTQFTIADTGVTLYDQQVYERITTGQPPYPDPTATWNVDYTITDNTDGITVAGIPLADPLKTPSS